MFASLAKSTLKQYCSALKQWIEFCETKPIPYSDTSSFNVLTFLSDRFKNGASYSTLKTMRSALSLISSNKVGELSYVSRFMKGVYKLRPTKPKYEFTWDTSIVLNKLETIDCTDIKILTYKTIMLLALGTAQRAQTLSLIKLSNITPVARGLEIRIPDIIKTSASERNQPLLQIPFFPEKPGDILRVIRLVLKLKRVAVDLDTIRRRMAGFSKKSEMFANRYKRPIRSDGFDFAVNILKD
ncbi:hypothetical protein TKK_0007425 [Trichogramma kaykai]